MQRHPAEEWRQWGIGDKTPGEVPRIIECRQFVAVKAVAAIGEEKKDDCRGGQEPC